MLVCLDNNILIWAVRCECEVGQEQMLDRAGVLLERLTTDKARIMVPSVVLSEYLAGMPDDLYGQVLETFTQRFEIHPFDTQAAVVAARLWKAAAASTEGKPSLKQQIKEESPATTNVKIKADIMILATAISRKADILYTNDHGLTTLAGSWIRVEGLPPVPPQQDELFPIQ